MSRFARDLTERALTSAAGALLALIPPDGFNIISVPWGAYLGVAGGAALVSVLKGIVARGTGSPDSAGLGT